MAKRLRTLSQGRQPRGVALIIVLAALVLVTILVLAFLTGIGSELQSSKMYANGSSVKLLAQSAVSLVIGEIQTATSNQALCWASEPGMIRTYDNTGAASAYYKLYSDSGIIGSGAFDHTKITNLIPDGTGGTTAWYKQAGVYVDLNQPIYFNNTNYYPILDGNSADYATASSASATTYATAISTLTQPAATTTIKYLTPVTVPTGYANCVPAVSGFWLNSNTPANPASPDVAPMPVKWLYVLQNGEVIVPDSNPVNNVVTFNNTAGQPKPSASDPIVGRIAYWTDDESCKVNINTASEGTFWDTPRCYSAADYNYAMYQPAQNEFQRYPGHPATVSLSAVFSALTADTSYPENLYTSGTTSIGIAPRTTAGGSKEGTLSTATLTTTNPLTLVQSRLYSTPDDFLFQPFLTGTPGTGTRKLNNALLSAPAELSQSVVQQAGFFITACSDAPDVNLFNQPRVSMWPITLTGASAAAATPAETAYDKLIAFCGTINSNKYYFQRWDPTSDTNDLPAKGTSASTSPLARNRDLLEYLRTLTSAAIPGFGGVFSSKYSTPGDRDQILTEMFDYIRCTNLQDSSTGAAVFAPAYTGTGGYTGGGLGQVVPIRDTTISISDTFTNAGGSASTGTINPRGFGRYPTVAEAALFFIGAGDNATQASGTYTGVVTGTTTGTATLTPTTDPNPPSSYTPAVASGNQRVQAGFFLQLFDPSEGASIERPWYQVRVSGLSNLQWNGSSIFPTGATWPYAYNTNGISMQPTADEFTGGFQGWTYGGIADFRQFNLLRGSVTGGSATANGHWKLPVYPFISPPTGMPPGSALPGMPSGGTAADMPSGGTFSFTSSGDVTVQIYSLDSTGTIPSTNPIQTINLNFPSTSFPVPTSIDNNPLNTGTVTIATNPTPIPSPSNPILTYLPSTFSASAAANYDFLSFLDTYDATSSTYGDTTSTTMGSAWGRLSFPATLPWISKLDVVRAIIVSDPSDSTSYATAGDPRLIAARQYVPDTFYQPIGTGFPASTRYAGGTSARFSHMMRFNTTSPFYGSIGGALIGSPNSFGTTLSYSAGATQYLLTGSPSVDLNDSTYSIPGSGIRPKDNLVVSQTSNVTVANMGSVPGDWDNGVGDSSDGAYINKPDEGDTGVISNGAYGSNGYPYFDLDYGFNLPGQTFFTPNRMIPSPGMFGSLPTGVWSGKAWQTLLFRPGPASHPGLGTPAVGPPYTTPPDHLFLDMFNMPVVEPYAISTPLATSGRINMNYLIIPFTYINRDTGLRAAMKNQVITAIPNNMQNKYKIYQNTANGPSGSGVQAAISGVRYSINLDSTLSEFLARFYNTTGTQGADGAPDIFRSASEICDIDLVPTDPTGATVSDLAIPITRSNMDKYWAANVLTGDNSRERPYANLYPLLTTKSNTFTVHYRVQTLKQALTSSAASSAWAQWREGTDVVTSEYRGSETIERYVDPNNTSIPDYASSPSATPATPLSNFYKFRVVSSKQFPP